MLDISAATNSLNKFKEARAAAATMGADGPARNSSLAVAALKYGYSDDYFAGWTKEERIKDQYWRLNNLYWIVNKDKKEEIFRFNWAQEELYWLQWYRNITEKVRQLGVSTFYCIESLDACIFHPNTSAAIICHKKDDAGKMFEEKVRYAWDRFSPDLKRALGIRLIADNTEELRFSNNSVICVTSSARSTTTNFLHISEFAKMCLKYPEKAKEVVTGSFESVTQNGILSIEATPEGRGGYYYEYCDTAMKRKKAGRTKTRLDFEFFFFPWWRHPEYILMDDSVVVTADMQDYFKMIEARCSTKIGKYKRVWYVKKRETLKDAIYSEHPSYPEEGFMAIIEGAIYGREMLQAWKDKRIGKVPYDPLLPVNTAWDLGIDKGNDMSVVLHQKAYTENRIIGYIHGVGEGLDYYVRKLQELGYAYGRHWVPHDIKVRELSDGRSRIDKLKALIPGADICVVERTKDVDADIEEVRSLLPTCYFDEESCDSLLRDKNDEPIGLIKGLENYQREWDDNLGVFKKTPRHNWASNPADAMRTLAIGMKFYGTGGTSGDFQPKRQHKTKR